MRLKDNPYDVDLNALTNTLTAIEADIRSFKPTHQWSGNHTKEYLVEFHKFPTEYNEAINTMTETVFKHWIYQKNR